MSLAGWGMPFAGGHGGGFVWNRAVEMGMR